jgi:hypothetical protein
LPPFRTSTSPSTRNVGSSPGHTNTQLFESASGWTSKAETLANPWGVSTGAPRLLAVPLALACSAPWAQSAVHELPAAGAAPISLQGGLGCLRPVKAPQSCRERPHLDGGTIAGG